MKPNETQDTIIGVAFDLSKTRTGISLWENQHPTRVLSWVFKDTYDVGHTLASFRNMVTQLNILTTHPVGWVAFEDVRPINKHHSELHFGMTGVLTELCYRQEVPILRATSSEVKKVLSGSGKADKDTMLAAAREKFSHLNVQNHDEADAVGVGMVAISKITWDEPYDPTKYFRSPF